MGMLLQHEQRADEGLLGLVDADAMELGQLAPAVKREGEHDGLATILREEGSVLQNDVHRNEKVEELLRMIGCQLAHRAVSLNGEDGNHILQQLL
jgi:hypothetical protein